MVKVFEDRKFIDKYGKERDGFYMDGILKNNIDTYLISAVKQGWDGIVLVTGMEGAAKSTLAACLGYYCDQNLKLDNVVFTQDEFFHAVDNADKGTVIIWDEFVMGGLSTEALGKNQNSLIKKLTTIRKKQLFIFLIIPSIFMLRLYFILRTRCLIHCYSPDGLKRGYFKFYSYDRKRSLYVKGRKYFSMAVESANFAGRFTDTNGYFFDNEAYEKHKDEAILSVTQEKEEKKNEDSDMRKRIKLQRDLLLNDIYQRNKEKYTHATFAHKLNQMFSLIDQNTYGEDAITKSIIHARDHYKLQNDIETQRRESEDGTSRPKKALIPSDSELKIK